MRESKNNRRVGTIGNDILEDRQELLSASPIIGRQRDRPRVWMTMQNDNAQVPCERLIKDREHRTSTPLRTVQGALHIVSLVKAENVLNE
jgi:hypothetical protein